MNKGDPCIGFKDKLYWRESTAGGTWHCYKRLEGGGYVSLCRSSLRERAGGQAIRRPEPVLRCGRCDGLEMERRGWEESGPTTEPLFSQYAPTPAERELVDRAFDRAAERGVRHVIEQVLGKPSRR